MQKQQVLTELSRASGGLTAVQLRERTSVPEGSLRTILWELRRDGLIDVVGGVRGRYRYGLTEHGREAIPDLPPAQSTSPISRHAQASLFDTIALDDVRQDHRTLRAFVRWLSHEHPQLFTVDRPLLRERLDELVIAFLEQDYGPVRRAFEKLLQQPTPEEREEP